MRPAVRGALAARTTPILLHMMHGRAFPDPGASNFSDTVSVQTLADTLAPKPVTDLEATAITSGIRLDMTLPTENKDGSTLRDLTWLVIYYHSGNSIDVDDPGTYTGTFLVAPASQWTDRSVAAEATRYYVVVARDDAGNNSTQSLEASAEADANDFPVVIPTDATDLVFDGNPLVGDGIIGLLFLDRVDTWNRFSHWQIQYAISTNSGSSFSAWADLTKTTKFGYLHKGLTQTSGYRYKYRGRPVGENDIPAVGDATWDLTDNGGTGWPSGGTWGSDNSVFVGTTILTENLIAIGEVRATHIDVDTLEGISADLGTITAGTLSFERLTPSTVEIIETMIETNAVTRDKIKYDEVRTDEMYIDASIVFNPAGSYNSISGCETIKALDWNHYIDLSGGFFKGTSTNWLNLDNSGEVSLYSGADIRLDAVGDILLKPDDYIDFYGTLGGSIGWAVNSAQSIECKYNGVRGRLAFYAT